MTIKAGFVIGTNVLVSALLADHSVPASALEKAENTGIILYSEATSTKNNFAGKPDQVKVYLYNVLSLL